MDCSSPVLEGLLTVYESMKIWEKRFRKAESVLTELGQKYKFLDFKIITIKEKEAEPA